MPKYFSALILRDRRPFTNQERLRATLLFNELEAILREVLTFSMTKML